MQYKEQLAFIKKTPKKPNNKTRKFYSILPTALENVEFVL